MGLMNAFTVPVRLSHASHYNLHRNIPAVANGFRWYSTIKKSPTKNGTPIQPCGTPTVITAKVTAPRIETAARCLGTSSPNATLDKVATKTLNSLNIDKSIPRVRYVGIQPFTQQAQSTPNAPPVPPSNSSGIPPSNSGSNNYWWLLLVAAAAGGGSLVYYNNTNSSEQTSLKVESPSKKRSIPATSAEIPTEIPYLLIGGGTASFAAFRAIKSHDPKAKVMVISNEVEMPYMRPPLSKELWLSSDANTDLLKFKQWNGVERSLYYEPNDFYINPTKLLEEPNGGVAIVRGYTVAHVDVYNRKAVLTDGTEIKYGECLLATGSSPKNLEVFETAPRRVQEKVSLFKTIEDFGNLKKIINDAKSVAIIGGGFLGSELACALVKYGNDKNLSVHQIFHEKGNMGKVLPEFLSEWTTERVREEGVKVHTESQVTSVEWLNGRLKIKLIDGSDVLCDHVVVAVGSEPNVSLAKYSGLEVDDKHGGYLVNAELEARRHLYVAGDAACFYDPQLGRRRVEHHDHAVVSGRLAGENMVGLKKPYTHQSMFWSDLGPKVGYEAIGIIDSSLPTVSVFAKFNPEDETKLEEATTNDTTKATEVSGTQSTEPTAQPAVSATPADKSTDSTSEKEDFRKGVIFYLRDEKIVGIVLWNVFNRINTARAVISEGKKYDDLNEVAKLFEIHS